MAFEQCLKAACKTADVNGVHGFDGTSERIIVNNMVKQGTGTCSFVKIDTGILQEDVQENYTEPVEPVEPVEGYDDEADIYGSTVSNEAFQQHLGSGISYSSVLASLWSG